MLLTFLAKKDIIYRQNLSFGGRMFYEFKHFGTRDYVKIYHGENLNFKSHLHQSFEFDDFPARNRFRVDDEHNFLLK